MYSWGRPSTSTSCLGNKSLFESCLVMKTITNTFHELYFSGKVWEQSRLTTWSFNSKCSRSAAHLMVQSGLVHHTVVLCFSVISWTSCRWITSKGGATRHSIRLPSYDCVLSDCTYISMNFSKKIPLLSFIFLVISGTNFSSNPDVRWSSNVVYREVPHSV